MSEPGSLHRYSRQIVLNEIGVHGQEQWRDASVVIAGVGGLGCAAATLLAGAGVGRLHLVDGDRVDVTNLHRQWLYRSDDLGRSKALAAAQALRQYNPQVEVTALERRSGAAEWGALVAGADAVLDCTDNFATRFAINAACVRARRPLVVGAAIRWEGQAVVFDLRRGGPCYACLFPQQGGEEDRCETAGILGPVASIIGAMQAHFALKLLAGVSLQTGLLHLWDARADTWRRARVQADPLCKVCGRP